MIYDRFSVSPSPLQNHLLAALAIETQNKLFPHLELVVLSPGEVLADLGEKMVQVYFPIDSTVSLMCNIENGGTTDVAIVGNDGVLGVAAFLGNMTAMTQAVVLNTGFAYRLPARMLKAEFELFGPSMELLLRYAMALITQVSQTSVCSRYHSIDQRLCRLLLLSLDRSLSTGFSMTQEQISAMLGVRREGVTGAASKLQSLGAIRYARGHIKVLDRPQLERLSCECYSVVKTEVDRLLPAALLNRASKPQIGLSTLHAVFPR